MIEFSGPVVVTSDETSTEVVARQGGAGGVIGAAAGADVEVELDGADPASVTTVRIWHAGQLSAAQAEVLDLILGESLSADVQRRFGESRPARVGNARSRTLNSLPQGEAPAMLVRYVTAVDALSRHETSPALRPLLELEALVAARTLGISPGGGLLDQPNPEDLSYAVLGVPRDASALLEELLSSAQALGIIDLAPQIQYEAVSAEYAWSGTKSMEDLVLSNATVSSVLRSAALAKPSVSRPLIKVDETGALWEGVTAFWVGPCNLRVRVTRAAGMDGTLWVRARRDSDNVIVAASPMTHRNGGLEASLLVAELDHVVVDVVGVVDDRLLDPQVGVLARAYAAGRRGGRLERVGNVGAADASWRECARLHALTGDAQREKLAMSRRFVRAAQQPPTLLDYLL